MTNHHGVSGLLSQLAGTVHLWRKRSHERRELAHFSERDLHDLGLSWSEMMFEAEKPFWRS
jgi:uncharacterized protein YjiS (DUF1127 family)